jgi:hypothetical protein
MLGVLLMCGLTACSTAADKKKKKDEAEKKAKLAEGQDLESDPDFSAFLGRLKQAVAAHDVNTLASMMTPNFGFRLNPVGEGDGVFQYWDQNNLWPQLGETLNKHFVLNGEFMVAPAEFTTDTNYHGFRAGITQVQGSWRFSYFVTD